MGCTLTLHFSICYHKDYIPAHTPLPMKERKRKCATVSGDGEEQKKKKINRIMKIINNEFYCRLLEFL